MLLLATSATSILEGSFQLGASWTTSAITDGSATGPSLTADTNGNGIGVYTSTTQSLVMSVTWTGGAWAPHAAVSGTAVAMGQPFLDATRTTTAHAVYQDAASKYWYAGYSGSWTAPLSINGDYGPSLATIAARGPNATIAFVDGQSGPANEVAAVDLTGGVWQSRTDLTSVAKPQVAPVIAALDAGPELLMVWVLVGGTQMYFATRTAGAWSLAAVLTNSFTNDRPALAPLPNGGAILAFRGTDTNLYWTTYSGGAWSAVAPLSTPNVSIAKSPAVTHGVGGAVAEIAFVENDGKAYHASLTGSTWSTPVLVGGASLNGVAIAAIP